MDNTQEYTCLSLCSGYGGLELGLKRVVPNVRTVAYVEVEAFACANLVAKMEAGYLDAAPVWTDIKTFRRDSFRGRIHIITAGYPCQGESHAGKRKGQDDPRWLWPYIERIIETVQPVWFFGENVRGHLSLGFPTVYRSLRNMGYKVESGLFSAAECDAPHQRCRLFILAYNNKRSCYSTDVSESTKKTQLEFCNDSRKSELAYTKSKRFATSKQGRDETARPRLTDQNSYGMWPAQPGQPQYEWEEPRVVDDTKQRTLRPKYKNKQQGKKQSNSLARTITSRSETEGQAKPQLGRAANGTSCRVDRLRLLGNGVVPQQAEKAFRCLMALFGDKK